MRYSDIWVNGLRAVQCGDWESTDYESDYGAMTDAEIKEEKKILKKAAELLNLDLGE